MWSRNKKLKRRNLPDSLGKKEEEITGQHLVYNGLFIRSCFMWENQVYECCDVLWIPLKEGIGGGRRRPIDRVKRG
jgi:hypothetical protein